MTISDNEMISGRNEIVNVRKGTPRCRVVDVVVVGDFTAVPRAEEISLLSNA